MNKQFYGIKYPFTTESDNLTYLDLNNSQIDSVRSMLYHIVLTPKGQRLRHPEFGTDLIKYIFEQNDSDTWQKIKEDIQRQVSIYLPKVIFNDVNVLHNVEESDSIYIEIDYELEENGKIIKNKAVVKI